jgi:imidazolonepropionase-like amidohydrolase
VLRQSAGELGVNRPNWPGFFFYLTLSNWNHLGSADPRILALIDRFRATKTSLTPTLHVFAQRAGLAYFESTPASAFDSTASWTPQQRARAIEGYHVMASYVKRMYDAGITLAVGTDTSDPGKAVLSEMLLLHDAGIPMTEVFRIATLSTAEAIGRGQEYGAIEPGRRADLIMFDGDPLTRPLDLLGPKVVLKDGVIVTQSNR